MIQLCRIRIKTGLTDLLIENWYTRTVKDSLWTICYPAISQIFIWCPPHIQSMAMSELLSLSSHAIINDYKSLWVLCLNSIVFCSYVQGSRFNPSHVKKEQAKFSCKPLPSTVLQYPQKVMGQPSTGLCLVLLCVPVVIPTVVFMTRICSIEIF